MDTFVDSSWYFLRYLLAEPRRRAVRPGRGATRGCRSTSTSAASRTRSCTCCTPGSSPRCCTTWAWSTSPSRSRACSTRAWCSMDGSAMSKSRGNLVRLSDELAEHGVDAVRLTMVFAGPPEDDIDWADVSPTGRRKFLARAWRLAGDVTRAASAPTPTTGDVGAAPGHAPRRRTTSTHGGRDVPLQRRRRPRRWSWSTPPARRSTPAAGAGRPGGARGRRGGRGDAVAVRAVHRRGDVGAAGPRADGRAGAAGRRSTRRCWSRRR